MLRKKVKLRPRIFIEAKFEAMPIFLGQTNFEARSRQWGQARPYSRKSLLVVTTIIYT